MLLGIISDTHDRKKAVMAAVEIFNSYDVELILHAGDFVSPFVPIWLKGLKAKVIGVYGNNEGERELLAERMRKLGHEIRGDFAEVEVEGKRIALYHGTIQGILNALINSGAYDIVVHGHTHMPREDRVGNTLVINSGEACGYLYDRPTIGILDVKDLKFEIYELEL